MSAQDEAVDLLNTAIDALRERALPSLSGDARTTVLMAINAIGVASRVVTLGDAAERAEHTSLQSLVGSTAGTLPELRRRLTEKIRAGEFDPSSSPEGSQRLAEHLSRAVSSQCAIDQPKALKRDEVPSP